MAGSSSPDFARVQKISGICAAICGLAAIAQPLSVALTWAFESPTPPAHVLNGFSSSFDAGMRHLGDPAWIFPGGIRPWQRFNGAVVSVLTSLILSYGLLRARSALLALARGDFFVSAVGAGLRDYAAALFWTLVAGVIEQPVLSVAVTFANPPGHRELILGLHWTDGDFFRLIGAGITWVIAAALVRASALAQENEQFV